MWPGATLPKILKSSSPQTAASFQLHIEEQIEYDDLARRREIAPPGQMPVGDPLGLADVAVEQRVDDRAWKPPAFRAIPRRAAPRLALAPCLLHRQLLSIALMCGALLRRLDVTEHRQQSQVVGNF
jgi:hypothetical protein